MMDMTFSVQGYPYKTYLAIVLYRRLLLMVFAHVFRHADRHKVLIGKLSRLPYYSYMDGAEKM
jgi:hypothetical protein